MVETTTVKIPKELHTTLQKRAETLGMTMGDYTERLLRMALDVHHQDTVAEFTALLKYKDGKQK
jgi:hypothetical protein